MHPTTTPEHQAAINFVVAEFGKHVGREQVVRTLAEQHGCSWDEAERFVRYVELEHRGKVARRQAPLLMFMGIGTLVGGIITTLGVLLRIIAVSRGVAPIPSRPDLMMIALVTGIAMIAGASLGLWQLMREMSAK